MNRLDFNVDNNPFTGKMKVNIPVIASTKKYLDEFFDGSKNVEQVTGITRGKQYLITEVNGYGDVFDVTFMDDNGIEQQLGSFFFEDIE